MTTQKAVSSQLLTQPHLGHRQRLRERFLASKRNSIADYEILEMLLFAAHPRGDVKPLAKSLIMRFENLPGVINASQHELLKIRGINKAAVAVIHTAQEISNRMLRHAAYEKPILEGWKSLIDYCQATMGHLKTEQMRTIFLDSKLSVIVDEVLAEGTINHTTIYPRQIIKRALEVDASAFILVHNHPNGDTEPSKADIEATKNVIYVASALNIRLHDHLIISSKDYYSFKNNGLI